MLLLLQLQELPQLPLPQQLISRIIRMIHRQLLLFHMFVTSLVIHCDILCPPGGGGNLATGKVKNFLKPEIKEGFAPYE